MTEPVLIKRFSREVGTCLADIRDRLCAETTAHQVACLNWSDYPERPSVSFRMGHTGSELWVHYEVCEMRILGEETRIHGHVYQDSCVELFLSLDAINYYNLEINCIGTPHLAYGPGRNERRFVLLEKMRDLEIESSLGSTPFAERTGEISWTLTARVPIRCFAFDAISTLCNTVAHANVYKCNSGASVQHYLTWQPIRTPAPDYHRPEFFGVIRFA